MSCISDKLLSKLASRVTIETLAAVRDRKDKLESRIYAKKVEEFVQTYSKWLQLCSLCLKLFTDQQEDDIECF